MSLSSIDRLSRLFGALAGNLWIPNYMGYGKSTGTTSEKGCYHTADAVYEYLTRDLKTPAKNIVAMGWSLGAAAIEMASSHSVAGVIALSPFTSIEGMAREAQKVNRAKVELLALTEAGHDDLFAVADREFWRRIRAFIAEATARCIWTRMTKLQAGPNSAGSGSRSEVVQKLGLRSVRQWNRLPAGFWQIDPAGSHL
ncbi:MAG: alpha/beta hydrolase [Candidatus Contendobacter sp.]|nr:MAG: alpha/beta hydrolase [Candidatus Contendobacter sp.]